MGFFDKVRDVLTGADAERERTAREAGTPRTSDAPATGGSGAVEAAPDHPLPDAPADVATAPADVAGAPATGPAEDATSAPSGGRPRTHTVQRGDTLAAIAAQHGVDVEELARHNGIDNPDLIYPGQVFRVPPA